jgi:dTDP-4-dehydrorhamnose reductase
MAHISLRSRPEVWAGVECTVNRVGDRYIDQLERTGHSTRMKDLECLSALGIAAIRYPVLWERLAPNGVDSIDWSWADERLDTLRKLRVKPIVGLLHHGSGPVYTNLLDPEFPEKLSAYAYEVAQRYPWVTDYTPINEPLTTARFSCLYGHWYPHNRDPLLFIKSLLNQCRAVVLAMRLIRSVNSDAQLIQTEDLGKTYSTPTLAYQADFENERRWLTFDLLCGRVVPGTVMWDYFQWLGIEEDQVRWFNDNALAPDILGINHYVTSERFLDERVALYPPSVQGGNGRHVYADVEAVRVCAEGIAGPKALMQEAWDRYHLPLAITEAHIGCTREEQLRWLSEIWSAAVQLRNENVDVRAVTPWAAYGAFDWNSLLTRDDGCYESGIFDLRSPEPRPTALAKVIQSLSSGVDFDHPVLDGQGWWHRLDRLCYQPVKHRDQRLSASFNPPKSSGRVSRPLLITGATGTLGQAFARVCEKRGLAYQLLSRQQMDIADPRSVESALEIYEPWAVINAAGFVRVDEAENQFEECWRENVIGAECLAQAASTRQLPFVTFSSDLVFDGLKGSPYIESDPTAAINVYGKSKAEAETRVFAAHSDALVIRTSALFGPGGSFNFVHQVLDTISEGKTFDAANDVFISPTYVPDLVNTVLDLLVDGETGIWHVANSGIVSWSKFAQLVAELAGYETSCVNELSCSALNLVAPRPTFTALESERGNFMPPFITGVERCLWEMNWRKPRVAAHV